MTHALQGMIHGREHTTFSTNVFDSFHAGTQLAYPSHRQPRRMRMGKHVLGPRGVQGHANLVTGLYVTGTHPRSTL